MKTIDAPALVTSLAELWVHCPEMRLGQLMATLGLLAEDAMSRSLWDVEDEELAQIIEQFRVQLAQRQSENGSIDSTPN